MSSSPTTWQAVTAAASGALPTSSAPTATTTSIVSSITHPLWRGAVEVALVVAGLVLIVAGGARAASKGETS